MLANSLLMVHVCSATIALISGVLSLAVRKGSGVHRLAGTFFFVSMLFMAGAGATIAAFIHPNVGNVMGGSLAMYLVATAWVAGRRRERRTGAFDVIALAAIAALTAVEIVSGFQAATSTTHLKAGYPASLYFNFGTICLLFALSDVRLLVRGGVQGAQRIARHLWRMCFALWIATFSFFPGQARLFTRAAIRTPIYYAPHIILVIATLYWLIRVRWSNHPALQRGEDRARPIAHAELAQNH